MTEPATGEAEALRALEPMDASRRGRVGEPLVPKANAEAAIERARAAGYVAGRAEALAEVVAWLQRVESCTVPHWRPLWADIASMIERGEHLPDAAVAEGTQT